MLKFFVFFLQVLFVRSQYYNTFDYNKTLFDKFVLDYNKSYSNINEYNFRMKMFFSKLDRINYVNNNNFSYKLEINKFSDLSFEEFSLNYKGYNGLYYPDYFFNKNIDYHNLTIQNNTNITEIDWREKGLVTPIKDQGVCGSCWAFSAVGTMEGAKAKTTKNLTSMSEQDLVDCVSECFGCNGGWSSVAIQYVIDGGGNKSEIGIDTEKYYPYVGETNQCNFSSTHIGGSFHKLVKIPEGNVNYLNDAVLSVGPISVAIDAEDDFQSYKSGIFKSNKCSNSYLDHAVLIVGYGKTKKNENYYIIKNSWGEGWGINGYMYFSADIPNMCGIAEEAVYAIY